MRILWLALIFALFGCAEPASELAQALPPLAELAERDFEQPICRARMAALARAPALPGAPEYEARRAEILGRARGEPVLFVAVPAAPAAVEPTSAKTALARITALRKRYRGRPALLRERVLRQGYVFSDDPLEAYALVKVLTLEDLFDEPRVWLMRGERVSELERRPARFGRGHEYRYLEGPSRGRAAKLLFADRVAADPSELAEPLHRDLRALRDRAGFERIRVTRATSRALIAELRFGAHSVAALIESDGAHLELGCLDADPLTRRAIAGVLERGASRRRALAALREAIDRSVDEELPFDRPRGAEDHLSDGQLRPLWNHAYRQGRMSFSHDEQGYPVFGADGRPMPPQMCVEMIVDAYERAAGSWYRPLGQERSRTAGGLDFAALGLGNRAGVLAFETFAASRPDLFEVHRIPDAERIAFAHRQRFFGYLLDHAEDFSAGDIIAIQGPKPDGYVHQHASLIVDTDPVTGFAYALADQMRVPRLRTFEAIMAEAPRRSLLYRIRPLPELLSRLDPRERERRADPGAISRR